MNNDEAPILNPNTADEEELRQLPGVGPQLAGRIIEGRPYQNIEELRQVPGLGDSVLETIEPFLEFETDAELRDAAGEPASGQEVDEVQPEAKPLKYPMVVSEAKSNGVGIWALLAMGAASVLCSITLTLDIVIGINGTLDYSRHAALLETKSELRQLRSQLETLQTEIDAVRGRAEALEGMSGRMTQVEGQIAELSEEIDGALDAVEEVQAELSVALEETRAQAERVNRFQSFLDGLSQLVSQIVTEP